MTLRIAVDEPGAVDGVLVESPQQENRDGLVHAQCGGMMGLPLIARQVR